MILFQQRTSFLLLKLLLFGPGKYVIVKVTRIQLLVLLVGLLYSQSLGLR